MTQETPDQSAIERMQARYREERDRRQVFSGRGALELTGDLAGYLDDPYTQAKPRAPLNDEVDVLCIGAGFAGLLAGARLREAGLGRIRLVDSAGDVGGVWYWNRYPEAKCDVESLIYMPLLEELDYVPTLRYATAPEIGAHARRIAEHYRLYDDALFHTTVTELRWDDALEKWHVLTDRGDDIVTKYLLICNGPLSKVKLPDIPGIDDFKGKAFHTSRWDYDYTGGGPTDPRMPGLADKRVGFVGTGATGLQCVAPLAASSGELLVFQRTPSTVAVRDNRPLDAAEIRAWPKGWQKRRQENFTRINFGQPVEEDLIQDGWTDLYGTLYASPTYRGLTGEELAAEKERVDFMMMERIRARIDATVTDPGTAERLKPYYNYLCKRPGFHDEYLAAFNSPNVTLVDTGGGGVERMTETGVVAGGQLHELDCLIFGTGFETETAGRLRLGFEVFGRGGLDLREKWKAGLTTQFGMAIARFPNLFLIPGVNGQAVVTANVVHMTQEYVAHIAHVIGLAEARGARTVEVTDAGEKAWVDTILARRIDRTAFLEACTPGRYNYEGNLAARPLQNTTFGGGPVEYFEILRKWREGADHAGVAFDLHPAVAGETVG
ncbi:MAG: NAD(P)/FAD-dependent oxidoreductase [Paracoccus sp. (in: a-proteobacteria)]|uniref:flavin-containing monooxygenase n=1 Tax=Paracoccus sp. TaxID=267 RepID=UPI0039E605A5